MEFNPIDKVNDLLDVCKEFNPIIRKRTNEGYDWLKDTDVCIEILNPGSNEREEGMTIICEDGGEFTLCFHSHTHFSPFISLLISVSFSRHNSTPKAGIPRRFAK